MKKYFVKISITSWALSQLVRIRMLYRKVHYYQRVTKWSKTGRFLWVPSKIDPFRSLPWTWPIYIYMWIAKWLTLRILYDFVSTVVDMPLLFCLNLVQRLRLFWGTEDEIGWFSVICSHPAFAHLHPWKIEGVVLSETVVPHCWYLKQKLWVR